MSRFAPAGAGLDVAPAGAGLGFAPAGAGLVFNGAVAFGLALMARAATFFVVFICFSLSGVTGPAEQ